jgi:hypothetical protein
MREVDTLRLTSPNTDVLSNIPPDRRGIDASGSLSLKPQTEHQTSQPIYFPSAFDISAGFWTQIQRRRIDSSKRYHPPMAPVILRLER